MGGKSDAVESENSESGCDDRLAVWRARKRGVNASDISALFNLNTNGPGRTATNVSSSLSSLSSVLSVATPQPKSLKTSVSDYSLPELNESPLSCCTGASSSSCGYASSVSSRALSSSLSSSDVVSERLRAFKRHRGAHL